MDSGPRRSGVVEAALGGFRGPTRRLLVPLVTYKSVFLGDWFEEVARQERDPATRKALLGIVRDTLVEAIELLETMRAWERGVSPGNDELASTLQAHALGELVELKQASTEALVLAAMHAPTAELRARLMRLADLDRQHAGIVRALMGVPEFPVQEHARDDESPLGVQRGRDPKATIARSVERAVQELRARGSTPTRLVVSGATLRHLRDEGVVLGDGTVHGLPVEVDFGWRGDVFAIETDERVRLAELLSRKAGEG